MWEKINNKKSRAKMLDQELLLNLHLSILSTNEKSLKFPSKNVIQKNINILKRY